MSKPVKKTAKKAASRPASKPAGKPVGNPGSGPVNDPAGDSESNPVLVKAVRIAAYVLLFGLGCAVGGIGAFAQAAYQPGGLLLALAGAAGLFAAGGMLMRSKAGAVAPVAGWLIVVFYLAAAPRPEGDWVLTGRYTSYLFLFGGSIISAMVAMQPWGGTSGLLLLSGERLPGRGK